MKQTGPTLTNIQSWFHAKDRRKRVTIPSELNPYRIVRVVDAHTVQLKEIYTDIRGWF